MKLIYIKKNKQNDIYNYINEVYKEKAKKIKDSVDYFNKEKLEDEEEQRNENNKSDNNNSNINDNSKDNNNDDFF